MIFPAAEGRVRLTGKLPALPINTAGSGRVGHEIGQSHSGLAEYAVGSNA